MKTKFLLFITLFLGSTLPATYGQAKYYNQQPRFLKANSVWCFGDYAGLNFNTGSPVPFLSSAPWFRNAQINSTSSIADPVTGKLLFYTNGKQFFKGSGQVMINGTLRDTSWGTAIVPIISQPGRYYVFSLNTPDSLNMRLQPKPTGLFYSIVDMSMDNNRGDVDPAYENVLLDADSPSSVMIAVLGDNCDDVWLLVYHGDKKSIKAYHITPQGIDPNPVISPLPLQMEPSQMAISPNRRKIALITNKAGANYPLNRLCIADFNAATGRISNAVTIGLDTAGLYRAGSSVCFSPDNSKLYAQISYQQGGGSYAGIYQYDVSVHDSTRIAQSITYVAETGLVTGHLKLYNDTIYVAGGLPGFGAASFLSRIHQPNLAGTACQYNNREIALATGSSLAWQPFNNEVVIPSNSDSSFYKLDTIVCSNGAEVLIDIQSRQPASGYNYVWNTGDTTASIVVDKGGTYKVTYNTSMCHRHSETYEINLSYITTFITVNGFELGATGGPFATYQWLLDGDIIPGATQSKHSVTRNGAYQVIVSNADGCTDTSAIYVVSNVRVEPITAWADQITIYPNPTKNVVAVNAPFKVKVTVLSVDGKVIAQQYNTHHIFIGAFPEGIYLLRITDEEGILLKTEKVIKWSQK